VFLKSSHPIVRIALSVIATVLVLNVTGGFWALLQSVAWTRMFVDYSRTASISTALEQTFDGKHPCRLCKMIQKEKPASEHPDQIRASTEKTDVLFFERQPFVVAALPVSWILTNKEALYASRTDPPPVPPPRIPFDGA